MNLKKSTRRNFFKNLSLSFAALPFFLSATASIFSGKKKFSTPEKAKFKSNFRQTNDRIWLGEKYWSIPMEDWRVKNGRIEFTGSRKYSRVNLLTSVLEPGIGEASIEVDLGVMNKDNKNKKGSAGFSIGIKDEIDPDVKAACYYGEGVNAGISTDGTLFIADKKAPLPEHFDFSDLRLRVKIERFNNNTELVLTCSGKDGGMTEIDVQVEDDITGLIALVNNFKENDGNTFWFNNIRISGSKSEERPENAFGPVLWSMHTISKGILKIGAQMPPLGEKDSKTVDLFLRREDQWNKILTSVIDEKAYIAHFQLEKWNSEKEVPYRLVYNNKERSYSYDGIIRKEPLGRPLKFGALTCQYASGYPYSPLVNNLEKYNPDILYFSGDQLYESNGGYPIKREPEPDAILSYLGKWYMFGWTFKNLMRDRPVICTPDDHDVFQGNIWGEGGEEKKEGELGGYTQTPGMVNVVHKTQCGHLPAAFHPQPLRSGITTWYTDLVYGKISFAIISDRMFKSGPEEVRHISEGRLDHIKSPLKPGELEGKHLELLGDRQMEFLEHWVNEWKGADMKVLLSQTLFCNPATHHGRGKEFLHGDMDSGGWPKHKRDNALKLVRKAAAFHVNGDQHLPFIVQYGVDEARDAGWTFCSPAISTGYPRWSEPDSINRPYTDRPAHGLPNTGVYNDGFGNKNYVYAAGNPVDHPQGDRYVTAQQKSSGFGMITFDTDERTIKIEALRFLADKDNPSEDDIFPGWPLTISQLDNDGRKAACYLPRIELSRPGQVVKVYRERDGELIKAIRTKGSVYQPEVYEKGTYSIVVGDGDAIKTLKRMKSERRPSKKGIRVDV